MAEINLFYTDMDDWRTAYQPEMGAMAQSLSYAVDHLDDIPIFPDSIPELRLCVSSLKQAAEDIVAAVRHAVGESVARYLGNSLADGILLASTYPEASIDAEDIIAAWFKADKTMRNHTVSTIDLLRKEMWDDPYNPTAVIDWWVTQP